MIEEILATIFYVYLGFVYMAYASFVAGFMHPLIEDVVKWLK